MVKYMTHMTVDRNIDPFFVTTKQILPLYFKTEIWQYIGHKKTGGLTSEIARNWFHSLQRITYKELYALISPYSTVPKINQDKARQLKTNPNKSKHFEGRVCKM